MTILSLIGNALKSIHTESTENYKKDVLDLQQKMQKLRFGYVPGVIRHGSKKNRKYQERWQILLRHGYDPSIQDRFACTNI